ncbi:rod shape-determining protein MreC [Kistimonas scapharcae]
MYLEDSTGQEFSINPIFRKGQSIWARFTLLMLVSLVLMFVDHRFDYLKHVRSYLGVVVTPIQWLADTPARLFSLASDAVSSHTGLIEDNARLNARNLILEQKLQKYAALTAQNVRLRELLNSSQGVEERVTVAELIGIDPDPQVKQIIINKGSADNVYVGQPLLDAHGVMGQVISVTPFTSRVLLITDSNNRVPVQVNRNGYRAIAIGTESGDDLELLHVPDTADIQEGDLLVSSGLGQRYPFGYPVAVVTEVIRDTGRPFARIVAKPAAQLNEGRLVMLVFTEAAEAARQKQAEKPEGEG